MNETSRKDGPESETWDNIRFYGFQGEEGLTERIRALEGEWDAEKFAMVSLSGLGLLGLLMGLFGSRLWRVLTWVSLPLLLLAGLEKWRPSKGIISTLGLRSRKENLSEKYALKALRGDFQKVESGAEAERPAKNSGRALDPVNA